MLTGRRNLTATRPATAATAATTATAPTTTRTQSHLPSPATAIHDVAPVGETHARPARWHFDIDDYLNPVLPPSPARRLPAVLGRFLGYRAAGAVAPVGNLVAIVWTFVGVFAAVAAAGATLGHLAAVQEQYHRNIVHAEPVRNPVFSVGIFGAAAVLEFYALDSPYAQPRSVLGGQLVSSIVGVSVAKLAAAADPDPVRRASRRWLAGALSTACASCLMALTGTVHPPGGATALLAVTDNGALSVGWWLVPGVLAGSAVMQAVALLLNNIQRRYPLYWWTPEETGQLWKRLARRVRRQWRRRRRRRRQQRQQADRAERASRASDPESAAAAEAKPGPDDDTAPGTPATEPAQLATQPTPDDVVDDDEPPTDDDSSDDDAVPIDAFPTMTRTTTAASQPSPVSSSSSRDTAPARAVVPDAPALVVSHNSVVIPDSLALMPDEIRFLEALSARL